MATNPTGHKEDLANASRDKLIRALEECREQLRRAEEMLRLSQQDNSPTN